MKKILIDLGKEHGLTFDVRCVRIGYDELGYELSYKGTYVWADSYFTGKTSTGVSYPSNKHEFLTEAERRIKFFKERNFSDTQT